MENFSASEHFDRRLYRHDIEGSRAHAKMLAAAGILSADEYEAIIDGLGTIREQIEAGEFNWSQRLEDVHMNIESRLTDLIGDAGKKLHTGRSRNDQVATDIRLFVREAIDAIVARLGVLQSVLVERAETEADTIMPGFTHMQSAQPVTLGHHLMAWVEMLDRDAGRFNDCRTRLNVCPLGAAALAGTSYPIDREMTAEALGFDTVSGNSLDSVSDRDFLMEFNAAAAILAVHLSRIAEELVLWSSERFGFVDLGDAFCTGSSIMPQKKNPDAAELVRGKSARVIGNLMALLVLMKGQPLAYNRDNQEDKEPLFDTLDTVVACLDVYIAMFPGAQFNRPRMLAAASEGFATATDLADYLVRRNMPFRDAHEIVGKVVAAAIDKGLRLDQLTLEELRVFCNAIDEDVFEVLTLEGSVSARDHIGGTAPAQVRKAIASARLRLKNG
ncbi:MAG: argininosuccinate lyase [marine bacterium B5-7]|nr:MAG: argininosuccinate lyase [marine bacterium B5-7]